MAFDQMLADALHEIDELKAAVAAAESRGRAAGYAEAVQRLRDDDRYSHWWSQLGPEHPEHRYWDYGRKQLADYLETVERLAEEPSHDRDR